MCKAMEECWQAARYSGIDVPKEMPEPDEARWILREEGYRF
jgi:hypothetical protein